MTRDRFWFTPDKRLPRRVPYKKVALKLDADFYDALVVMAALYTARHPYYISAGTIMKTLCLRGAEAERYRTELNRTRKTLREKRHGKEDTD